METSVPPPPSTHILLGQSPLAHKWAMPPAEMPQLLTLPCPGPQSYSLSEKDRSFKRELKMQSWPTGKMIPALIRKWWGCHGNDNGERPNFPMTPTLCSLCTCSFFLKRTFPPPFSAFTSPQLAWDSTDDQEAAGPGIQPLAQKREISTTGKKRKWDGIRRKYSSFWTTNPIEQDGNFLRLATASDFTFQITP